ncbi:MAG TPA: virulence RhuM family protein [Bacteroidales bacterium]|nr:virulence RhuM family protein [Bacteroidales bacterium]HOR81273.1 virulence RhuM family protein [Bacteroidales bacterium]HPJ90540.1 virulence RhuM family protein [Bacteroidales bacterium]HQB19057.1 virulence RhuM family protein [Bacteroidales bacterium]
MEEKNEMLIYQSDDGNIKVDVLFTDETVWLTQEQICILFGKAKSTISEHIANIFEERELQEALVVRKFRTTTQHGAMAGKTQSHYVNFYNLDVIISVGYRVKSLQGTQFRIWATQRLRDYIIKGFALNDERFKSGSSMNYFKELLERIREIRLSERIFYQQIKDIYATSIDYNPSDEITVAFYKEIQNKLLWAVSGKTAAELIYFRANASLPQMGLTSTAIPNKVRKKDIEIGKNYLNEDEIRLLKLIVEQFLAFAETQATQHIPMYMKDWIERLKQVLSMNRQNILEHAGSISHDLALQKANEEYDKYKTTQKQIEHLESIKELEQDIKKLKTSNFNTNQNKNNIN